MSRMDGSTRQLAPLLLLAGCTSAATDGPWLELGRRPPDAEQVLAAMSSVPECHDMVQAGGVIFWHSGPVSCGEVASTTGCSYPDERPPRVDVVNQGSAWSGASASGFTISTLAHELCHVCGYLDEEEADACARRARLIWNCHPEISLGYPVSGRWTLTGAMNEPRSQHALTLLADGRVLVAGGCKRYTDEELGCTALATAEIYDPVTGIWTPTGSMNQGRRNYGAVLLPDGRVLVAGGCSREWGIGCMTSAEIYDPATGAWTPTGSMTWPRSGYARTLVLLRTGRVLFPGGWKPGLSGIAPEAEVYDPASGTWELTGPMVTPRGYPTAVLLPSGEVLVVGGVIVPRYDGAATATAETYDPEANAWTATGSLDHPVCRNTLTLLPTGKVLLSNGFTSGSGQPPSAEARLWDPVTRQWSPARTMRFPRQDQMSAVRLASGRVLVAGGNWIDGCNPYRAPQGEIYDPWLDTWTPTPVMPHYVNIHEAAVLLQSGDVLLAGGNIHSPFWLYEGSIGATQVFREEADAGGPDHLPPEVAPPGRQRP